MLVTVWITKEDRDWGKVDVSMQEMLPFHYAFPGKLDRRHPAGSRLRIWDDMLPAISQKAKSLGFNCEVENG